MTPAGAAPVSSELLRPSRRRLLLLLLLVHVAAGWGRRRQEVQVEEQEEEEEEEQERGEDLAPACSTARPPPQVPIHICHHNRGGGSPETHQ